MSKLLCLPPACPACATKRSGLSAVSGTAQAGAAGRPNAAQFGFPPTTS